MPRSGVKALPGELACPACGGAVFIPVREHPEHRGEHVQVQVRRCIECGYVGVMEHAGPVPDFDEREQRQAANDIFGAGGEGACP